MKKTHTRLATLIASLCLLIACQKSQTQEYKQESNQGDVQVYKNPLLETYPEAKVREEGNRIATAVQTELLKSVSQAIGKAGEVYAIAFCNEKALPLTDSLSQLYGAEIRRFSDKNRQPQNAFADSVSQNVFKKWQSEEKQGDEVVYLFKANQVRYYKPIHIGMETCLRCHGDKQNNLSPEVREAIAEKYPQDSAHGYQIGELRGGWEIVFKP
jgi:hypothetical protein